MVSEAPNITSRRWQRFSIKALLAFVFVFSIFLAWWFTPFDVEKHVGDDYFYVDPGITIRYTLRRTYKGGRHFVGPAFYYYDNGQVAVYADVDGLDKDLVPQLWSQDSYCSYWSEDGTHLSNSDEFYNYLANRHGIAPVP